MKKIWDKSVISFKNNVLLSVPSTRADLKKQFIELQKLEDDIVALGSPIENTQTVPETSQKLQKTASSKDGGGDDTTESDQSGQQSSTGKLFSNIQSKAKFLAKKING